MIPSLEDTIIAYFDHRLSDAESAELLHDVSVDSNSRALFKQYENVRSRVRRAQANVVVYPEMESKLFSNLEQFHEEEVRALPYWIRFANFRTPAIALGLAASLVGTSLFYSHSLNTPTHDLGKTSTSIVANTGASIQSSAGGADADLRATAPSSSTVRSSTSESPSLHDEPKNKPNKTGPYGHRSSIVSGRRFNAEDIATANPSLTKSAQPIINHSSAALSSTSTPPTGPLQITYVPSLFANNQALSLNRSQIQSQYELPSQTVEGVGRSHVEFAVWGATGSLVEHDLQPVGGFRVSGAYFMNQANLIGLRVSSSRVRSYAVSPAITIMPILPEGHDDGHYLNQLSEEIYLEHREPIFSGRFFLTGALGAGFIPNGNELSAELGLQLPLTSHLTSSLDFALTRNHYYSLTDVQPSRDNPSSPNAIGGRFFYGLSYEF